MVGMRMTVETTLDGSLVVGGRRLALLREGQPARLPWQSLAIDTVFECTGALTKREDLDDHIRAGARDVIVSAPSKSDDVETIVHGVNAPERTDRDHFVRELYDELHHTRDGDSWATARRQEGDNDDGARLYRESSDRRHAA
jgi:hypothetical protein